MLFGLVVCSVPAVRRRLYESFYWSHLAFAVTYLGLCFWHFGQEGDSWNHLWATLAVWLFSILGRIFVKNQSFRVCNPWPSAFAASLLSLSGEITRVDMLVPLSLSWRPGQHCYVRLPLLSPFDNHPFTIASASNTPISNKETSDGFRKMTFFVRTHQGFTRKLETYASSKVDMYTYVWLDGPYGGVGRALEKAYDTMILKAGGSGITACLSWLLYCVQKKDDRTSRLSRLELIWMIQDELHAQWVLDELEAARVLVRGGSLAINVFVTRKNEERDQVMGMKASKEEVGSHEGVVFTFHSGRPFIPNVLPTLLTSGRNVVIGSTFRGPV